MFLIYIIDFENNNIPANIGDDAEFKERVIEHAKKELNELREIDDVIRELLRSEDFNFTEQIGIYAIQNLGGNSDFNLEFGEMSFSIKKDLMEKLVRGFRILYVPECTIFVPVLVSPKWIKGLISEKNFEMQIYAPGFTLEEKEFHLEVVEYNSNQRTILEKIADGRLLVLYMKYSLLN